MNGSGSRVCPSWSWIYSVAPIFLCHEHGLTINIEPWRKKSVSVRNRQTYQQSRSGTRNFYFYFAPLFRQIALNRNSKLQNSAHCVSNLRKIPRGIANGQVCIQVKRSNVSKRRKDRYIGRSVMPDGDESIADRRARSNWIPRRWWPTSRADGRSTIVSCGTRKDIDSILSIVSIILGFIGSPDAVSRLGTGTSLGVSRFSAISSSNSLLLKWSRGGTDPAWNYRSMN